MDVTIWKNYEKIFSAEMAFENLPNVDAESSKNLFRECMLAPNDFRPPTDDMRLSFEDEDFKVMLSGDQRSQKCNVQCFDMTLT